MTYEAGTRVDVLVFFQGEFLCQAALERLKPSEVVLPNFHYMCTFCGKEWTTLMRLEEVPRHAYIQRRCPSCPPDQDISGLIAYPLVHVALDAIEVLERDFLYLDSISLTDLFHVTRPE